MNKLILTILLIFSPIILLGQLSLEGRLINQEEEPYEFVEVSLLKLDSTNVVSTLTDENGNFNLPIAPGNYIFTVIHYGERIHSQNINLRENTNLKEIKINFTHELNEVIVFSPKPTIERLSDRLVFNIQNSIAASGGDGLDVLKITPGLRLRNDQISMVGKSNFALMVNDRIVPLSGVAMMDFIRSLKAENIKSIEVITNPPAKYDANGNGGLINIRLKDAALNNWSNTLTNSLTKATYWRESISNSFSYQKNKISLLANLGFTTRKSYISLTQDNTSPENVWTLFSKNTIKHNLKTILFNLNYQLNKKSSLGLQINNAYDSRPENSFGNTSIYNLSKSEKNRSLDYDSKEDGNIQNQSYNLNYTKNFNDQGKKISLDFDYFNYVNEIKNTFTSLDNNLKLSKLINGISYNNGKQDIANYAGRLDFEIPWKESKLNFGTKFSFSNTDNYYDYSYYDIGINPRAELLKTGNNFNYDENIQAIYFSWDKNFQKKWSLQLGLRLENTQTKSTSPTLNLSRKYDYTKLFPTFYISNKINDNHSINFNFGRRIQRPDYYSLNPARKYFNLNSYKEGNPFLQPSFSYNFEFSHIYKDIFTSAIIYSNNKNEFTYLTIFDLAKDEFVDRYFNFINSKKLTINESLNLDFTKWWNHNSQIYLGYQKSNTFSALVAPKFSGFQSGFNTSNTFYLNSNKTLLGELNYNYEFKSQYENSTALPFSSLDIGIKYQLFDKKLQLSLLYNNILFSDRVRINEKFQEVKTSYKNYYDTQNVRFTITYKFGNSTININSRSGSNDEEKNRVGN